MEDFGDLFFLLLHLFLDYFECLVKTLIFVL